ncbi:MAG: FGGY family carbohydrate kinase [Sulfolobales archaeon]
MFIASIDLGTTHVKVALLNFNEREESLTVIKSLNLRIVPIRPEPSAYEHDPKEVLATIKQLVRDVCRGVRVDAIVLTTYLFGLVLTDAEMRPITNIITWLDERPYEVLRELQPFSKELYVRTGCPHLHVYTLPKLLWLRRRAPSTLREAKYFIDAKALLMNFLTGSNITDLSSASGTYQMLNIRSLKWDELPLSLAGIDESSLPEVREGYYSEHIKTRLAYELGIDGEVPVVLGVYDGASMIYGLTGGASGLGVINMGSSAMIRALVQEPIIDSPQLMRFQTYYLIDHAWLAGGAISNGGIVVEHLIRLLYDVQPDDVGAYSRVLSSLSITGKRPQTLISIPLLYPERLPINPARRVSIVGLDITTKKEDIILSAIEGVIMLLALLYRAMEENGISVSEVRVGGKLTEYPLIRKLIASILGKEVVYSGFVDASHLGNLLLLLRSLKHASAKEVRELCEKMLGRSERTTPMLDEVARYRNLLKEFELIISKLYSHPTSN